MFLDDLKSSLQTVKSDPEIASKKGNVSENVFTRNLFVTLLMSTCCSLTLNTQAAVYGLAASLPAGPVDELLATYTDCVLDS
jgi:hypothetical protein